MNELIQEIWVTEINISHKDLSSDCAYHVDTLKRVVSSNIRKTISKIRKEQEGDHWIIIGYSKTAIEAGDRANFYREYARNPTSLAILKEILY